MSSETIGHNGGPPFEKSFNKRRWAEALFTTPNKPTGTIAMGFLLYMRMDAKGGGAAISDAEFMVACNVSDKACRNFKRWLVKAGFIAVRVRGYRGYRSEYQALIPEHNTGMNACEYRNAIPEQTRLVPELDTGIAASAASAKESFPRTPFKETTKPIIVEKQTTTTTTVEYDAASGGGEISEYLNGSAVDIAAFISKHAMVDGRTAQSMLSNNVKAFTADAMLEAYSVTLADMASPGMIARPYKYLIEIARKLKDRKAAQRGDGRSERWDRRAKEIAAKIQGEDRRR